MRLLLFVFLILVVPACRQKMAEQPSYRAYESSPLFNDGRVMRPRLVGTIARGELEDDSAFFRGETGRTNGVSQAAAMVAVLQQNPYAAIALNEAANPFVNEIPLDKVIDHLKPYARPKSEQVDDEIDLVLRRGKQRFEVFCTPCHDYVGGGNGMIVQRGFARPPSLHIPRLRQARLGYLFKVMTEGLGAMPEYRAQVPPEDRWAIAAYIRALQFSQRVTGDDLGDIAEFKGMPDSIRKALQREEQAP